MEFLTLILLTISVFLILVKPKYEKWAYGLFVVSLVLTIGMDVISTSWSLLPYGNL